MTSKKTAIWGIIFVLYSLSIIPSAAEINHFNPISNTGNNSTVIVKMDINPTVSDEPLTSGDEIGVFTPAGLCVGMGVWNNENLAITIWGDDATSEEIDGITSGESFVFKIWDSETETEHGAAATFAEGSSSTYDSNIIIILDSLNGTGDKHFISVSNTGNNSTVIVKTDINPTVSGEPLTQGDEIGVFSPAGLCVGMGVWNNENLAITIWGDDATTEEIDGITSGESFVFKIWDSETETEYGADATFAEGSSSTYDSNIIIILDSLNGTGDKYFISVSNTGNNSTVVVKTDINPTVSGEPLTPGDEIGVFTPAGLCVGMGVWNNENLAITIWGDDATSEEIDGIQSGEEYNFKVWDSETQTVYISNVTYSSGNATYIANDIVVLASFLGLLFLAPPTNVQISDVPDDNGHSLLLTWVLSSDDAILTHYEIFRSRNLEAVEIKNLDEFNDFDSLNEADQEYMIFIGSVDSGENNFIDSGVPLNGEMYYYWIQAVSENGISNKVIASIKTQVEDKISKFVVNPPFPNPFNPRTTIRYELSMTGKVTISIYNALGQQAKVYDFGQKNQGVHEFVFDASELTSGIYFYRVDAGYASAVGKMLYMK